MAAARGARHVPMFPIQNAEKLFAHVLKCLPAEEIAAIQTAKATAKKIRPEPASRLWETMSEPSVLPPRGLAVDPWFEKTAAMCKLLLDVELPRYHGEPRYLFDALGTDYEKVALTGTLYRIIVLRSIEHQIPGFAIQDMPPTWAAKWEAVERDVLAFVTEVCARKPEPHPNYIKYITCMFGRCVMCTGPIKEKNGHVAVGVCASLQAVPIMWHPNCMHSIYVTQLGQPISNFGASSGNPIYHRDPASFQKQLYGVRGHVVLAATPGPLSWLYGPACPHQKDLIIDYLRDSRPKAHDGRGQIHTCSTCMHTLGKGRRNTLNQKNSIALWASTALVDTVYALSQMPPGDERVRAYEAYVAAFDAEKLNTRKPSKENAWRIWKCACADDKAPRFLMAEAKIAASAGAECICIRCLCVFDLSAPVLQFEGRRYWCKDAINKICK